MTERLTYSPDEAAAIVGVSRTTIARAYTSGALRVIYLGKGRTKPRIDRDDLLAWVKSAPEKATA